MRAGFRPYEVFVVAIVAEMLVQHVGQATGHAGTEVDPSGSQDQGDATGHVFAAMIAHTLGYRQGAAVADGKAFPGNAGNEQLTGGRAVQCGVSHQDVATQRRRLARGDGDDAPAEALADIVIALAVQAKGDSRSQERAEALSGYALKLEAGGRGRERRSSKAPHDFAAERSSMLRSSLVM